MHLALIAAFLANSSAAQLALPALRSVVFNESPALAAAGQAGAAYESGAQAQIRRVAAERPHAQRLRPKLAYGKIPAFRLTPLAALRPHEIRLPDAAALAPRLIFGRLRGPPAELATA